MEKEIREMVGKIQRISRAAGGKMLVTIGVDYRKRELNLLLMEPCEDEKQAPYYVG
jgi:hypothetical protein